MKTYVVWDSHAVKVGRATDVGSRIAKLQTGNPNRLVLIAWSEQDHEGEVQRRLRNHRTRPRGPGREWFDGFSCSRELAQTLVDLAFTFEKGWDAYRFAALHNRRERRARAEMPGDRLRASAAGRDRLADQHLEAAANLESIATEMQEAWLHVVVSYYDNVMRPVEESRLFRVLCRLYAPKRKERATMRQWADHCREELAA